MLAPVVYPSTLALTARVLGLLLQPGAIMTNGLYSGREIAEQLERIRRQNPEARISGNRYKEKAAIEFYLPDQPRTFRLNVDARPNQYDFWQPPEAHMGKDFILVRLSREAPAEEIANLFRSWEALPPGIVQHYGTTVRHYRFFLMRGFCGRTHQLLSVD